MDENDCLENGVCGPDSSVKQSFVLEQRVLPDSSVKQSFVLQQGVLPDSSVKQSFVLQQRVISHYGKIKR